MKEKLKDCKGFKSFTRDCMCDSHFEKYYFLFQEYWKQANSISEFKKLVFADNILARSQGYAELSKESDDHWYRVREMFGNKSVKTYADAGGVLIRSMDHSFNVVVPNGIGDGTIRCAVFEWKERNFNTNMMNYTGVCLTGDMEVMEYDCANYVRNNMAEELRTVAFTLHGEYAVYCYEGLVAFVGSKNN